MTGTVGEGDGWVEWTTCDSFYSYLPSIACGNFLVTFAQGPDWGARSRDHGVATIVDLTNEDPDDQAIASFDFVWCRSGALRAAGLIAKTMEHPCPDNVVSATNELWFAKLLQPVALSLSRAYHTTHGKARNH